MVSRLMRKPLLSIIVFAFCFGLGISMSLNTASVPTEKKKRIETEPPSAASDNYDFFANTEPSSEKNVGPTKLQKTFCTDPEILPIWKLIRRDPEVREALDYVWSSFDVSDCKEMFELKYVDLDRDGRKEILVRARTVGLCGAVGNCAFWIIKREQKQLKILLYSSDYFDITEMGRQTLSTRTNGYSDVILKGHFSAAETSYSTYKFNGRKYVERKCLYHVPNYANPRYSSEDPTWHFITCKAFYKSLNL